MAQGSDERPSRPAVAGVRRAHAAGADAQASRSRGVARDAPLILETMTTAHIPDGLRLCRASGWNQLARDWAQFLALGPDAARVAVLGGRIVGTAATMRYDEQFAWIGMVLVDPAERGRGIGTLLLEESLRLLADLPAVRLDATPAGHGIYLKHGFADEYRLSRLHATIPAGLDASRAHDIRPMHEGDLADVIAYDRPVFGANRAAMLRWMFDGAPEYAWIAREHGRVAGYTFGRHGFLFEHVGPVVAATEALARELAVACLAPHAGREFVIDAPPHAPAWLEHLQALAFRAQRPLIRMCRGPAAVFGDPSRQFAVLGPEFG